MKGILIRFTGANTMRIIDGYAWTVDEPVQEVDVETAANLLTYPTPQFTAEPGQKPTAAALKKLSSLTGLNAAGVKELFEE